MQTILVIKHVTAEGPGTMGQFLKEKGIVLDTVELAHGEKLPSDVNEFAAVMVMGGPMNVYQEDEYPFLKEEDGLIKNALKRNLPLLGICLGSQLLAKAVGAKVSQAPQPEIGWFPVTLTGAGRQDPLFKGIDETITVFQWHEDTFELPDQGEHLVAADTCAMQGLKVGPCAYGLQFHFEADRPMIDGWLAAEQGRLDPGQAARIRAESQRHTGTAYQVSEKITDNFIEIMTRRA